MIKYRLFLQIENKIAGEEINKIMRIYENNCFRPTDNQTNGKNG